MENIHEEKLEKIYGGTSITGTLVNALTNIIELLYEAGYSLGSSARRIKEGNICPLK